MKTLIDFLKELYRNVLISVRICYIDILKWFSRIERRYKKPYDKFLLFNCQDLTLMSEAQRKFTPEEIYFFMNSLLIRVSIEHIRNVFARQLRKARRKKKTKNLGDAMYRYVYIRTIKKLINI